MPLRSLGYLLLALALSLSACTSVPATSVAPGIPKGMSVEEYPLTQAPPTDSADLLFASTVRGDPRQLHLQDRGQPLSFETGYCQNATGSAMTMCAQLGHDELVASAYYNWLGFGTAELQRNGKPVYRIGIGQYARVPPLQGLWAYDGHWVLETAYVRAAGSGNSTIASLTGRIAVDGQLLNSIRHYSEAFGFQPLHDRPFFFYRREGKIGISFDGLEVPLGYDEVPHYGCCSEAALNPQKFRNMVAFFARRGQSWYYVQLGMFDP